MTSAKINRWIAATAAILAAFIAVSPAHASSRANIKQMIIDEALNSRVPPELALAVATVESGFDAKALSSAGARGVMQIMPKTARDEFGVNPDELWNPRLNIQLGVDYLERLYDQYGGRWDLALSHYNGGTLKGDKGANAKPHGYTRKYVAAVQAWQKRYADQSKTWRVADKTDRQDGWRPARTKVQPLPPPSNHRIVVRQISPRVDDAARHALLQGVRTDWPPLSSVSDFDDPGFAARLAKARRSLSDFALWDSKEKG